MASTKSKSKMKQQQQQVKNKQGKSKAKPPRLQVQTDKDVVDLEDSGVHLEEPLTPGKSSSDGAKLDQFFHNVPSPKSSRSSASRTRQPMTQSGSGLMTSMHPPQGNIRISKSESPQPRPEVETVDFTRLTVNPHHKRTGHATTVTTTKTKSSAASSSSQAGVQFTLGPEVESDEDSSTSRGAVSLSGDTSYTDGGDRPKSSRDHKHSKGKGRFKKMLRPLRRSHSAGCSKDVPAHALFLRHEVEKWKMEPERRSLDRGRGSMDNHSSDTDSEEMPDKSKSKSSKKTLVQDVKEKFSFLRRRHTDTALSSKDKGKPSTEVILSWSKSFENLLQDKYGLELFRDFLRTEFSEENVEFWIACEEYKSVKSNKLEAQAQKIFSDFVAVQAPREINLDSKTRLLTSNHMSRPNRQTFEVAQKRIEALMEKDSYPRFLQSDVYQELLGDQRHKLNLKT